ncbi:hypothetical protein EKO23_00365 [Nocardioides guangzhouensis]|uniref:Uncharacterized protein n=1 Tax=Nocardioides guangzhouensis TaxID=2497878 RepID=A0A4V1Y041_9ACTN|nr:hypothetical protein [Nocardioides guangzhouensis]RYP88929.1 hypothetical protein EKO23_00365 [Nocardioides guangzhouensis]
MHKRERVGTGVRGRLLRRPLMWCCALGLVGGGLTWALLPGWRLGTALLWVLMWGGVGLAVGIAVLASTSVAGRN